jgi:hypothetical protein
MDVVFVAAIVAFIAATCAFAVACEQLGEKK